MDLDQEKVEQTVLALLYLNSFQKGEGRRAWKGFPWTVMDALHECYDPEIPVNIVDLGLVYNIDTDNETGHVEVKMTLTALGCPMAGEVMEEVQMRVEQVENVKSCKVELTFDPPWSPDLMTEDAKWELGMV